VTVTVHVVTADVDVADDGAVSLLGVHDNVWLEEELRIGTRSNNSSRSSRSHSWTWRFRRMLGSIARTGRHVSAIQSHLGQSRRFNVQARIVVILAEHLHIASGGGGRRRRGR
jgi:hypothetical protein